MIHLITELSKYVMIILFAIYTWYSYVVLVIKNEERQKRMYKAQTTCMFLIHLDAFMVLFAVTKDFKILIFYGAQVLFVLFLFLIYRIIYKRAARLVVNHMCMLLLVGFIILTRLNFENAIRGARNPMNSWNRMDSYYDEDGKFIIRDYKNGGAGRDASTLSGGETFLASLALALALSAEIQLKGTAPLELFFLDEGFGTLDDNLLEVVMSSLERIHNDKLKVGIISHVESIKNRVPVKLLVTPAQAGMGGSKVKIERS